VDSLAIVVRSFKSAASRQINLLRQTPATPVWQRNDYEHAVRNEDDVNRIRQYIVDNPARWSEDEYYRM
jgi:REP element-mobilizing transposase RayT